jgi:hypothetical protein
MELMAPVRALERLKWPCVVRVHTGSSYVRTGVTQRSTRVLNVDLWRQLGFAIATHDVRWRWVESRADNPDALLADRLAAQGMRDVIVQSTSDDSECHHLMSIASCSWCKPPPPGILSHGYRTAGGRAYHNAPDCEWLLKGQEDSLRLGKNVHDIVRIAWGSVNPGKLAPCESCCTDQWLRRHGGAG